MSTTLIIPASKDEFLALKGNFSEIVKVTILHEDKPPILSGLYVFERTSVRENHFVRKLAENPLIQIIECDSSPLLFDRQKGVILNNCPESSTGRITTYYPNYLYKPIGLRRVEEYDYMKQRLEAIGEWR